MGIDDPPENTTSDIDKHQWVVKKLETILSDEEEDSMEESEESEEDIKINDEIEDSTTLGKF